jgi:hypothetical protein
MMLDTLHPSKKRGRQCIGEGLDELHSIVSEYFKSTAFTTFVSRSTETYKQVGCALMLLACTFLERSLTAARATNPISEDVFHVFTQSIVLGLGIPDLGKSEGLMDANCYPWGQYPLDLAYKREILLLVHEVLPAVLDRLIVSCRLSSERCPQ